MNPKERLDCRHDLGLVRDALAHYDEHGNLNAAAREFGLTHSATIAKWRLRRERLGGDWPTVEDVAEHRARNDDRNQERAIRRATNQRHRVRKYLAGGGSTLVSSRGVGRRLQALAALGWTQSDLADHSGWSIQRINHMIHGRYPRVTHETFNRAATMYDELCMIVPIDPAELTPHAHPPHAWARRAAQAAGWAPPLAWDDIDTDAQPVHDRPRSPKRTEIDHAVIERVLAGENLSTTQAERFEIMRRWLNRGNTENALNKRMGWNTGRYLPGSNDLEESA